MTIMGLSAFAQQDQIYYFSTNLCRFLCCCNGVPQQLCVALCVELWVVNAASLAGVHAMHLTLLLLSGRAPCVAS